MQPENLQALLNTIETYLTCDLTTEWLAREAGYSEAHFCRLFSKRMGVPLHGYILERRLKNALYLIAQGEKAVDVVPRYGFDTYAGFYKAFVRTYGCPPTRYRKLFGAELTKPELMEVMPRMTHAQIKALLQKHYAIDHDLPVYDVYYMDGQKRNDSAWQIGEKYTLKRRPSAAALQRNIHVAKALDAQGISAPLPVQTFEKTDYFKEGDLFYLLSTRLPGQPLTNNERFSDSAATYAAAYGSALSRLHKALLTLDRVLAYDMHDLYQEVMAYAVPRAQKQAEQWAIALPEGFFEDYAKKADLLKQLPTQIIHRDPNPGNILFENGVFTGFIDFELSRRSARLFDVCYCATGILSETVFEEKNLAKWLEILKNILLAYDRENPLTDEEKHGVFTMLIAIDLICVSYFGEMDTPEMKRLAQVNRRMLEYIVSKRAWIEKIFQDA